MLYGRKLTDDRKACLKIHEKASDGQPGLAARVDRGPEAPYSWRDVPEEVKSNEEQLVFNGVSYTGTPMDIKKNVLRQTMNATYGLPKIPPIPYSGKSDHGKPRLALVPPSLIEAVGKVLTFGADKYEDNGWKKVVEKAPERYKDAMMRHLCAYLEDENSVDFESGYPHLWHMACCVTFLIEYGRTLRTTDSRYDEAMAAMKGYDKN